MSQTGGLDRANALVAAYGRHIGAGDLRLDNANERYFGESGFQYDPTRDVLTGRVFVAKAKIKSATEKGRENLRKVGRALNDPRMGGMFDRNGGYFILDEDKEIYFLAKDFPVATTDASTLRVEMDQLMDLGATWTIRWFYRLTRIAHGHEPPPTVPVTRKNDPR